MNCSKTNFVRQGNTNEVIQFSFYNLTTLDKTLGQILYAARKKSGLTQDQLAKAAKISKPYVGTIENMRPHPETGALPKPDKAKIIRLVNALNEKLSSDDQLNIDLLLIMVGHAPESSTVLPEELAIADFDGFDKQDLKDIADYINFKRMQKEKEEKKGK